MGYAEFNGKVFSDALNVELDMWNLAMSGFIYIPVDWPVQPYLYADCGRSFWDYDIVDRRFPPGYVDSSTDPYTHAGFGIETPMGDHLRLRVGYRVWRTDLHPEEGKWAIHPEDYFYRRKGIELAIGWEF